MQKDSNKVVALGLLGVMCASTLGSLSTPVQAGWIRHHKLATAAAVVGGAIAYHHYKKKHRRHVIHRSYRRG